MKYIWGAEGETEDEEVGVMGEVEGGIGDSFFFLIRTKNILKFVLCKVR